MLGRVRRVQGRARFADFRGMLRPDASFGQILDEKLERDGLRFTTAAERPVDVRGPAFRGAAHGPVFLFGDVPAGVSTGGGAWTSGYPRPRAPKPPVTPRRPPRHLTGSQQCALEVLRGAGASGLVADFTEAELKSAYRTLARRYHPDRHPDVDGVERAILARTFASVNAAYRELARIAMN